MLGYALVRKYGGPGSERLAAGLAIFGSINVPLVYLSTMLWNTLHPKSSVVPSLEGAQRGAFWASVLLFLVVYILFLRARIDLIRAERRVHLAREAALDAGLF
jgi:heme exporter protein C